MKLVFNILLNITTLAFGHVKRWRILSDNTDCEINAAVIVT